MSRKVYIAVVLIVVLVSSMLATALMVLFTQSMSWLASVGWVIFLASLQTSVILAAVRNEPADACTAWVLRLFGRH